MKEKRKIELLSLLRDLSDQGAHPTLREIGMTEAEAQELGTEKLVVFGDTGVGDDLDRLVVAEIEDRAILYLTTKKAHRSQHVVSHTPPKSVAERIAGGVGSKLWDLIWDAGKISCGVFIGWYLKKFFP
jgi:hypothetical protein